MMEYLPIIPVLLFSVIVHELAHGAMALRLGDPTARDAGRLTFNPIPHIDPVGSVLVPLLSLATAGQVFIAWAKPVPINPGYFKNIRRDEALVSVVGPFSNIALAVCCTVGVILVGVIVAGRDFGDASLVREFVNFTVRMLYGGVYLNVVLAVFNLLPIPPLDGSHLLAVLLPRKVGNMYRRIGFLGVFALILALSIPAFESAFEGLIGFAFAPFQAAIDAFLVR